MNLIRKNIKWVTVVTIYVQITVIFSFLFHNHKWHYLKLFSTEIIDIADNNNHKDPYSDETGLCRINNYIPFSFFVTIAVQSDRLKINEITLTLFYTSHNYYNYQFYLSSGLRSPPLS